MESNFYREKLYFVSVVNQCYPELFSLLRLENTVNFESLDYVLPALPAEPSIKRPISYYLDVKRRTLIMDNYVYSVLKHFLESSETFKELVYSNYKKIFCKGKRLTGSIQIFVIWPDYQIINYPWCKILDQECLERKELDYTMCWLSTLGGAFSSLGDSYIYCAQRAGTVSAHQFCLALRLGDPGTVIRCKLYFVISLVQQSKFKRAALILRAQYKDVLSMNPIDQRLVNMCLGIWSKLKYERANYKKRTSYYLLKLE